MSTPTITSEIHEPFYVHGYLTPAIPLNRILFFNDFAYTTYVITVKIIAAHGIRQVDFIKYLSRRCQPNAVNIGQSPIHMFIFGKVYSSYTCQDPSPSKSSKVTFYDKNNDLVKTLGNGRGNTRMQQVMTPNRR